MQKQQDRRSKGTCRFGTQGGGCHHQQQHKLGRACVKVMEEAVSDNCMPVRARRIVFRSPSRGKRDESSNPRSACALNSAMCSTTMSGSDPRQMTLLNA